MGVYDINYDIVTRQATPVRLRKPRRLAWLRVLASGVKYVYVLFMAYRTDTLYKLRHNSQVCYMEAVLNDAFDSVERRIYIDEGPEEDPIWLYLEEEEKDVWLALVSELPVDPDDYAAPTWLYTDMEMITTGAQFIVYYPEGLAFDLARMRALINYYRLPSKYNYLIQAFT